MPSKYSHSVVLAQQSSCGLISLPNDQYIDYLRSSPLLATKLSPQTLTTAPSTNRGRATSTKTTGPERPRTKHCLRQQSSVDQLNADAYQHQIGDAILRGRLRRPILDSDDVDDYESSYIAKKPEGSRLSDAASSIKSSTTNPRSVRMPQRLPIEVQQQVSQNTVLTSIPQGRPQRREQKAVAQPIAEPEAKVRSSFELPIQNLDDYGVPPTRRSGPAAQSHNRNVSISKSLATPQLSPSGTEIGRAHV